MKISCIFVLENHQRYNGNQRFLNLKYQLNELEVMSETENNQPNEKVEQGVDDKVNNKSIFFINFFW